ncbi:putative cytochrome p450 protein [Neofusicoccum parvum UCRNP2]|uniref:Putative cytochrome p450 protein n=1 Tax=Botryosphaeria parva (strain UCR-NP2) TaxID=1287680 RepID=R1EH67_BOTPV|nr:putative cytochrome p450 protein [Neofusicoccum parvum UCRNP2]
MTISGEHNAKLPPTTCRMAILLHDLLRTPDKFFDHIKRSTGSVANIIIWGHRGATYESFWGYNVYRSLEGYSRSLEIGANPPVDQFPFLQRIPDFLAPWKRRAKLSYRIMADTGPLGVPHCAKQDDWYNGFLIPKDAMILMPIWAIHRYESNGFENPDQYNPDRYMNHKRLGSELTGIPDYENRDKYAPPALIPPTLTSSPAHHYSYGAGRRVCVGMHLAERTVWRMTAKILWAYELVPVDVDPKNFHEGIQHYPEPFKVEFRPRSEAHVRTIVREAEPALEFLSKYE